MEAYFGSLGIITIFDVSLLVDLPVSYIFSFKQNLPDELSPSTPLFPLSGEFISQSIIIP